MYKAKHKRNAVIGAIRCSVLFLALSDFACPVVTIDADEVTYDLVKSTAVASGNVVVRDNGVVRIKTQQITYSIKEHKIDANGGVVYFGKHGEKISTQSFQIDDKLKNAVMDAFELILANKAYVLAESGVKKNEEYIFKNANYSPCYKSCNKPLWEISASEVLYSQIKKEMYYKDAKLKIKGKPIFYMPYFAHPSFEVKSRSGFVTPVISSNHDIGMIVGIPYFYKISNNKTIKFTPFLNIRRRIFFVTEYKQASAMYDFSTNWSILSRSNNNKATDIEKTNRWHINTNFSSYKWNNKQLNVNINYASDIDYITKYPVSNKYTDYIVARKCNTSHVNYEQEYKNLLFCTDLYSIQTQAKKNNAIVYPNTSVLYRINDNLSIACNILCFKQKYKQEVTRFSGKFTFYKSYILHGGMLINFNNNIRIDKYNNIHTTPIFINRIDISYPLLVALNKSLYVVTPKFFIASTRTSKSRQELDVNVDSYFENLINLRMMQINTIDKIDYKEHIGAGIRIHSNSHTILEYSRYKNYNILHTTININKHLCVHSSIINMCRHAECGANFSFGHTIFSCTYFYRSIHERISQLGLSLKQKLYEYWHITIVQIFDLMSSGKRQNLLQGGFIQYDDECFEFSIGVYKANYNNEEKLNKIGFIISLKFKNLFGIVHAKKKCSHNTRMIN